MQDLHFLFSFQTFPSSFASFPHNTLSFFLSFFLIYFSLFFCPLPLSFLFLAMGDLLGFSPPAKASPLTQDSSHRAVPFFLSSPLSSSSSNTIAPAPQTGPRGESKLASMYAGVHLEGGSANYIAEHQPPSLPKPFNFQVCCFFVLALSFHLFLSFLPSPSPLLSLVFFFFSSK